ncbi:unnamed protein product [Chironomus riparius]|uniref:Mediator of RNA polymerase II transcription subunit 13 n=1 Tax=Chironomus riparius TaxID=315576 RepID=A0A9P0IVA9_9DIPT|nr:unnamed protein product [Chironomus riparius]
MTHQNQTNGASLEDCHTNFFALADLCGIKWKKLVLNERPQATGDPLDDPVLKSYTKCLAKDILCVWRRVTQHKNDLDQTGGLGMFDISQNTSVIHPPLSLTAAKELWIFWYGEEPDLTDLVSPELLKSPDSGEQGSWEGGLSYECRSLLFKALHNLIERCLLSRDIIRLGKWFVQPSKSNEEKSSMHLSFSFAFFVHGDSTVCASMDIREHPPVRHLTEDYLNDIVKNSQQNLENCELEDDEEKEEFNVFSMNTQPVILAPFGLSAVLTGSKNENSEQYTEKIVEDWNAFYPMKKHENERSTSSKLPKLVEVISGGVKMLYPSKYVLITDLDINKQNNNGLACDNKLNLEKEKKLCKCENHLDNSSKSSSILYCDGIQKSAAGIMPERIWQDIIMNPAYTNEKSEHIKIENNRENSINIANSKNVENSTTNVKTTDSSSGEVLWNFVEPCLKNSCNCKRSSDKNSSTHSNEVQQMSIGSVGSQSPMQHSLSVHSQPSSIPLNDQNLISPNQQPDTSPQTPSHENSDQKPEIQNLKTLEEQSKLESSQQNRESCDSAKVSQNFSSKQFEKENQSLKRPALMIQDCENNTEEDYSSNQLLYDYSTWDAWMNHPIKRFKSDNVDQHKLKNKNLDFNLYAGHDELTLSNSTQNKPNYLAQDIKSEVESLWKNCEEQKTSNSANNASCMKENKSEIDNDKISTDSLFTSEGLQPSYADLNKIFDNSDDNSNDDHLVDNTPPHSNKSMGCHPDMELSENEAKRDKMTFGSFTNINSNGQTNIISSLNSNNLGTLGIIRSEELSKMFPTPPSIEQHTNSSPGPSNVCGSVTDNLIENLDTIVLHKMDSYPNFGSPQEEPIDDWSYVFIAPKTTKIVGSSKYAPLNNLLSQTLPPITLPNECNYKPSWIKQREQEEIRRKQKDSKPELVNNNNNIIKREQQSKVLLVDIKKEIKTEVLSPLGSSIPSNSAKPLKSENTIINKLLSQGPTTPSNMYLNNRTIHPSMGSPNFTSSAPYNNNTSNMMASDSSFRKSNIPSVIGQQHSQPPPPYDLAIHSPSLNSNVSSVNGNDDISNNNNKRISSMKCGGTYMKQNNAMNSTNSKVSEANSLLVNILLYDTSLNIFRDHNFDSCTICVCNATPKCVGNIRGSDSGVYLSLASNCHFNFNSNLTNLVEKTFEVKCSAQSNEQQSESRYFGNSRNFTNVFSDESPSSLVYYSSSRSTNVSALSSQSSSSSSNHKNNINTSISTDLIPSFMSNAQQNLSGYADDDPIFCRCGFSAVINRRLAYKTGLFYEDEMEITGMARDPSINKKHSILKYLLKLHNETKFAPNGTNENDSKQKSNETDKDVHELAMSLFDIVRDQCTLFQNTSNTIQRAIKHLNQDKYSPILPNSQVNVLEFIDALDIVSLALEQSKYIFEKFDGYNNRQVYVPQQHHKQLEKKTTPIQHIISVHKWPYLNAGGPKSNQDIIRVMKSMKVLLQKAFNQNGTTGLWDAPYAVRGPLTWREFHRLAGRGIGQCEPQPIPSIVVGHDKEWLCVSPYALQFWDKLLLEPYSYPRDIAYIVISPDNDFIVSKVKAFFKELSTTYEMCRLGKHQPVKGWEGILKVGKSTYETKHDESQNENIESEDDWLFSIDSNKKLNGIMKMYDAAFQQHLVPYLSKIPHDKTLLNPPESFYNYKDHHHNNNSHHQRTSSLPSPMLPPPHTPESNNMSSGSLNSSITCDKGPNTPKSDNDSESKENLNSSSSNNDLNNQSDQLNPPHIVLYIIEPATNGTDSTNLERVVSLSILKHYLNVLNSIPESIKANISFQIIAQESILELGKNRDVNRWSDHMRNLALSVFTQSYRYLSHTNNVKSLTGFGTAAVAEAFLKTKDEKNRTPLKLYTPPYILSTRHAKSENVENFGQSIIEQQCTSIMYCCYCLSEDQSLLLAVITDERGEFLENCAINIDIPNRKRRRKTSARRVGLKKLMDFILGIMSQSVKSWRLIIGRIGRIGHGELKGWSWLLSKPNLVKASKYLKDICKQCSVLYPQAVPSIWSACLVTLEPDSNFRVMPDQFTPDERFSQRSTQSPLSTPQDVTCTHILVFPTSAISQSSQTAFQEQHLENALDFGEDLMMIDDTDDVDEDINGIQHLFDECWNDSAVGIPQTSPTRDSHRGSPIAMDENKSRQSPGMTEQSGSSRALYSMQEQEEVGTLLQQPLALGYLVSTAPTGRMPSWFWASCPHLENVCPVFLKTALHLHSPSIHKENDDIYFKEQSSKMEHPLDSNITADVLRYVLEGYNVLSWLAMDSNTHDRLSCLPIHVQMLMQLYHLHTALA